MYYIQVVAFFCFAEGITVCFSAVSCDAKVMSIKAFSGIGFRNGLYKR